MLTSSRVRKTAVMAAAIAVHRRGSGWSAAVTASEEDAGVLPDLAEAHAPVRRAGGRVEVVDVQAHDRGDPGAGVLDARRRPGRPDPAAAVGGCDPHALDLAGPTGNGADLGLEEHLALLHPRQRLARSDQLGDPGPVPGPAVGAQRADADLLGEHGDGRRHEQVELGDADRAHPRLGRGRAWPTGRTGGWGATAGGPSIAISACGGRWSRHGPSTVRAGPTAARRT